MRRNFAKGTKFLEAKSADTLNASDSRESLPRHIFFFTKKKKGTRTLNKTKSCKGSSEERAECGGILRKERSSLKQNPQTRLMRATQESPFPDIFLSLIKRKKRTRTLNKTKSCFLLIRIRSNRIRLCQM